MYKYFKYLLIHALYFLGYLVPRNKNIWLFKGFDDDYIDNCQALFEFINKSNFNIMVVCITN